MDCRHGPCLSISETSVKHSELPEYSEKLTSMTRPAIDLAVMVGDASDEHTELSEHIGNLTSKTRPAIASAVVVEDTSATGGASFRQPCLVQLSSFVSEK